MLEQFFFLTKGKEQTIDDITEIPFLSSPFFKAYKKNLEEGK